MKKIQYLQIRVTQESKDRMQRKANDDMRSIASLIEVILTEWLAIHDPHKGTKLNK